MVGGTETLSATVQPSNATDKAVQFSSSDEKIAKVTQVQGKVTGVAAGTATITATTSNGKTAVCEVTVTAE
nr:MAG TPA: tail tube protein [Caudoviricetes sp.]